MRHRVRIQPYISADLRRKLAACSAAQETTESAIAEAALAKYLEPDGGQEALVVRRLDGLTRGLARLQDDMNILAQAFGRFAWYLFTIRPPEVTPEGIERGEAVFRRMVETVANDLGAGVTLAGTVRRKVAPRPPRPPHSGRPEGGRDGDSGR